jgi:hypothetical protein
MARSTFDGPILSGDNRFGAQRNVGPVLLSQSCLLDFSNTTIGTAGYGGSSGIFVTSNTLPNSQATIYTPQAGSFVNTGPTAATAPTADASGTNYRGAVFLLPYQSYIQNIYIDNIVQPTDGTNAVTAIQPYIANNFVTTGGTYATVASITGSSVGRSTATFTAAQYVNAQSTLQDVQNLQPGQQPTWFSQVVVNLKLTVTSLGSVNAGKLNIIIQYVQNDQSINVGNATTYPYGNYD